MSKETALILVRWIIALTLITKGALMLLQSTGGAGGGIAGAAGYGLFAFALAITGVLLIARELTAWVSAPIWRFITGIVFPDDKFDRPPVNYALPRSYRERRKLDDAIEEYLKIIRYHPQELPAYLECIEVMIETGDRAGAEKVRATGLKKLRSAESRREVKEKLGSLLEIS
jgi:hypothetical protein